MNRHTKAQINALDRVMYLLEESSFRQLEKNNDKFADFVEDLYDRLDRQVDLLRRHI